MVPDNHTAETIEYDVTLKQSHIGTVVADSRGRVNLGACVGNERVRVVVLDVSEPEDEDDTGGTVLDEWNDGPGLETIVQISPERNHVRGTDGRGRITLGHEYAGKQVRIGVVQLMGTSN